jgi:hypothetical protein
VKPHTQPGDRHGVIGITSNQAAPSNCQACASADVFGPLRLFPETGMGEGDVLVATTKSCPFWRPKSTPLTAWVCRRCGHLDLFAADPEALYEHWSAEYR